MRVEKLMFEKNSMSMELNGIYYNVEMPEDYPADRLILFGLENMSAETLAEVLLFFHQKPDDYDLVRASAADGTLLGLIAADVLAAKWLIEPHMVVRAIKQLQVQPINMKLILEETEPKWLALASLIYEINPLEYINRSLVSVTERVRELALTLWFIDALK
jgi:hypothetical protein